MPQEHGAAITIEQHHRVIDEAGENLAEIEPATDVARDPSQGIRAVQLVSDVVRLPPGRDHRCHRSCDSEQQVVVEGARIGGLVGCDDEHTPRSWLARNGNGDLVRPKPENAAPIVAGRRTGLVTGAGSPQGGPQQAEISRQLDDV